MGNSSDVVNETRLCAIDAGRVVAAALIIFTHWLAKSELAWLQPIGFAGVPFFISVAVLLTVRQSFQRRPARKLISARIRRVLVPFAVWTGIYFLLTYVVSGWVLGGVVPSVTWIDVLTGCGGRLWFLPLVFVVGLCVMMAAWVARQSALASAAVIAVSLASAAVMIPLFDPGSNNVERWPYEAPVALAALGFAIARERGWARFPSSVTLSLTLLLCAAGLVALQVWYGVPMDRRATQAAGVVTMIGALVMPNAAVPAWLTRLSRLSYGVYVSHMVLILVLNRALGGQGQISGELLLAVYPALVCCAFAAAWLLTTLPVVRRAMP